MNKWILFGLAILIYLAIKISLWAFEYARYERHAREIMKIALKNDLLDTMFFAAVLGALFYLFNMKVSCGL